MKGKPKRDTDCFSNVVASIRPRGSRTCVTGQNEPSAFPDRLNTHLTCLLSQGHSQSFWRHVTSILLGKEGVSWKRKFINEAGYSGSLQMWLDSSEWREFESLSTLWLASCTHCAFSSPSPDHPILDLKPLFLRLRLLED